MSRYVIVGLCLLGLPGSLRGQESLLLRRKSDLTVTVHTVFQTVTRVSSSSGRNTETADLGVMRLTETTDGAGREVLHLTYDSVLVRVRNRGPWREFAIENADTAWVQVRMDERMQVTQMNVGGSLVGVTELLPVLTGVRYLVLPERELRPSEGWTSQTEISVAWAGMDKGSALQGILGRAHLTLDSIVARTSDTLGFISVTGVFGPTTLVGAGSTTNLRASGHIKGQLVWSTGWGLFVSGATQTRLEVSRQTRGAPEDGIGDSLTLEKTTRYQVRP